MHTNLARQTAWMPPPARPTLPTKQETSAEDIAATEPTEEEAIDSTLAELLAAAECDMGCDCPEGPLSPDGCHW